MGFIKQSTFLPILFTVAIAFVVIIGFTSSNTSLLAKQTNSGLSLDSSSFSLDNLQITFKNEYGTVTTHDLYAYDNIVEPYKTTTIGLNLALPEKYSVSWQIGETKSGLKGSSLTQVFTTVNDVFKVTANIYDSDAGKEVTSIVSEAACKYVRREIRTLTDDDRNAFLDALEIVYNTDQTEGQSMYGEKFINIRELVKKHLDGAGRKECDHWHDDAAILTHHVAYTLQMEQSLQSINPSVTVPYWDHTIDAEVYADDYSASPIFNDDWFGEANPAEHEISSGRWEGLSVTAPIDGFDIYNAYGHMRSPWNNNPSAAVGRCESVHGNANAFTIPSCSVFSECFNHDTLAFINNCMNGATHGPVHIKIGGAWGLESDFMDTYLSNSLPDLVLLFKLLWRHGYARCPTSCDADTAASNCTCYIPEEFFDKYGAYSILEDTNMFTYLSQGNTNLYTDSEGKYHYKGISADDEDDFFKRVVINLANPGITGEMYTSAAPWDPTFWPLHPTAERLVQYRIYLDLKGEYSLDGAWGYLHDSSIPSDDQSYCDWSGVEGLELPNCYTVEYCPGHEENATLPFSNFLGNQETYTNAEFLSFMGPTNTDRPYIYDNYDYSFCSSIGDPIYPQASTSAKKMMRTEN